MSLEERKTAWAPTPLAALLIRMFRRSGREAYMFCATALAIGCIGCSSPSPKTAVVAGSAAPTGMIAGHVFDATTHAQIAGALITAGAQTTASGTDGGYTLAVGTGKVPVMVSFPGYLTWSETIAVGGDPFPLAIRLVKAGPAQLIDAQGGTVAIGPASVTFPAGAFATPTLVTATWLPQTQVSSFPGPVRWQDVDRHFHRVHTVLHIETAVAPVMPATVQVPAPTGADTDRLSFYILGADGSWTGRISPIQISAGLATFELPFTTARTRLDDGDPDDTDVAVDEDTLGVDDPVVEGDDAETGGSTDMSSDQVTLLLNEINGTMAMEVLDGDALPLDAVISTPPNQTLKIAFGDGSVVDVGPGATFTVLDAYGGFEEPSVLSLAYGRVRAFVLHHTGLLTPVIISPHQDAVWGVRGTAFTAALTPCPPDHGVVDHTGTVEVTDGTVAFTYQGGRQSDVTAGQALTVECIECTNGTAGGCVDAGVDAPADGHLDAAPDGRVPDARQIDAGSCVFDEQGPPGSCPIPDGQPCSVSGVTGVTRCEALGSASSTILCCPPGAP